MSSPEFTPSDPIPDIAVPPEYVEELLDYTVPVQADFDQPVRDN